MSANGCKSSDKRAYMGRFELSCSDFGLDVVLNPNKTSSSYFVQLSGSENCKDDWHFNSGNDLHTSTNINGMDPAQIGIRQYDGQYNAKVNITAQNVTIQNNTRVRFEAGEDIILDPGFIAEHGSDFVALIGECPNGCNFGNKPGEEEQDPFILQQFDSISYVNRRSYNNLYTNTNSAELNSQKFINNNLKFSIYPNPNNGIFELKISSEEFLFPKNNPIRIKIHNSFGQVVLDGEYQMERTLSIPNAKLGLYLVTIYYNGKSYTEKLIIQ